MVRDFKSKIAAVLLSFLVISCGNGQNFQVVPSSKINSENLLAATDLTNSILDTLNSGSYYKLSTDEAETRMVRAFTMTVQRSSFDQVEGAFGEYGGIEFDQMVTPTDGTLYEIYRFKGKFGLEKTEIEIRTVLNSKGKLAGFFMKPWRDDL